ncbi:hypothetical protein MTR67_043895 [Solanum verrucosum]|uniref:Tf2-1-like SH3-like domain-containing protein n=1 Tax=Solanum verrucosum TaxID=315347 RepID=A0AAF0ZV54_SOLVR|nr:hypothetical protein MTR67_043895 [Solanum verrucosum]
MAPFEALYGRGCRSPIGWFEAGDVIPLGVDLMKDVQDKVRSIQTKLLVAQSRQKKYANRKVRDMTFQTGEQVLLKVSPIKWVMRFGKKGKLSPRYIGPFEILDCEGPVAYRLALPPRRLDTELVVKTQAKMAIRKDKLRMADKVDDPDFDRPRLQH